MREMKDSGIEWLGIIPKNWKVFKVKNIAKRKSDKNRPDEQVLSLYRELGIVIKSERDDNHNVTSENTDNYRYVEENDIVVNKMKAWQGSIAVSAYTGIVSPAYYVYKLTDESVYPWFVHYMLRCKAYLPEYRRLSGGIRLGQWDLSDENFKNIPLPIPATIEEQKQIVDYLDAKCSKIDEIIEKQQAIIEKLKEYKLSIITEAVTSGINPDVEMKDSHVLSIGCIPTNWNVTKLKYLFGNGDNGLKIGPFGSAMKGKTLESGLYKIYNQAHLIQNDFSLNRHFVSEDTFNDLKAYEVKPGDVLFSMMGTIGKCQIMPEGYPRGIMDSHLLKARLNEKVIPEFFIYAYDKDFSNQVIQQLLYTSNGTIMNGLNSTILKNVYIALPPIEEQEEIVEFLNNFTKNIDDRIGVKVKIVEKLQEYKKSLIYEVVTGKKEV